MRFSVSRIALRIQQLSSQSASHWLATSLYLLLAAVLLAPTATAQAVEPARAHTLRLLDLAVLEDPAGALTPGEAAAAAGWKPSPAGLNAGYSDSVWWLRFTVADAGVGRPHAVLRVRPHYLDELRLYRVTEAAPADWPVQIDGDHLPAATRPLGGLVPAFLLDDASPEAQHYLLRLRTTSAASLQLELLDERAYLDAAENEALLIGMDLGLQVVVLMLLAVQCWLTRHRLALLVTLVVAMHFVWRDNINGL